MNSNEQMERAWQRAGGVDASEITPEDHLLAEQNIKGENATILKSLMSRRTVLQQLSVGTLALMAGVTLGASHADAQTTVTYGPSLARDVDILNFALNDEYLESEFYSYATSGKGIDTFGIGITGQNGVGATATPGTTTGGAKIDFSSNPTLGAIANQLADDERKHVNFVRNTIVQLGGTPIAKPSLNLAALSALGVDATTVAGFLIAGRSFCDVGVSAYAGTSKYLTNANVIQSAAQILAVEAFHAGNLRLQIAQLSLAAPKLDPVDVPPPPANPNYFPVDTSAFAVIRTVRQVLNVFFLDQTGTATSGGFFPNGVNANTGSLLTLA